LRFRWLLIAAGLLSFALVAAAAWDGGSDYGPAAPAATPMADGAETPVAAASPTPALTPVENGDTDDDSFPLAAAIAISAGTVVLVGAAAAAWLRRS